MTSSMALRSQVFSNQPGDPWDLVHWDGTLIPLPVGRNRRAVDGLFRHRKRFHRVSLGKQIKHQAVTLTAVNVISTVGGLLG